MSASRGVAGDISDGSQTVLRDVLSRIGDKWSVIVLCRLDSQPWRFNELRRLVEGILQRMLTSTLRQLERDGLVERTVWPTVPPRVEYALTDRGHSLHDVLYQLVDWTGEHFGGIEVSRESYDEHVPGRGPALPC